MGLSYTISFILCTLVFVYILDIPSIITLRKDLVDEYYRKHPTINLPLDYVIVYLYILMGNFVINKWNVPYKIPMISFITSIISYSFYFLFTRIIVNNSFFYRWFNAVKLRAILYDVIFVTCVYTLM